LQSTQEQLEFDALQREEQRYALRNAPSKDGTARSGQGFAPAAPNWPGTESNPIYRAIMGTNMQENANLQLQTAKTATYGLDLMQAVKAAPHDVTDSSQMQCPWCHSGGTCTQVCAFGIWFKDPRQKNQVFPRRCVQGVQIGERQARFEAYQAIQAQEESE
jgi:hypothetical protein